MPTTNEAVDYLKTRVDIYLPAKVQPENLATRTLANAMQFNVASLSSFTDFIFMCTLHNN